MSSYLSRALCRGENAGEDAHRGRFSRPVRTEQADNFSLVDSKAHIRDGGEGAVQFGKAVCSDHTAIRRQNVQEGRWGINSRSLQFSLPDGRGLG
jgi:hypothetical protein